MLTGSHLNKIGSHTHNYNVYIYNDKSDLPISPLYEEEDSSSSSSMSDFNIDDTNNDFDNQSSEEKHDKLETSSLNNDEPESKTPFWESNEYSISSKTTINTHLNNLHELRESSTIPIPFMTNSMTSNIFGHKISTPTYSGTPIHSPSISKHSKHSKHTNHNTVSTKSHDTFKSRYNEFSRKWNMYIRSRKYKQCERLCNKTIDAINPIINHQSKRYNDRNSKINKSTINELKIYRSQIRHLYGVLCYKWMENISKALKQYELALMDDQNNCYAHCNLATLYRRSEYQEYQLSEMHYKKAIQLNPKNARFHYNYALLLQHNSLRKYNHAKQQYIMALKCNPKYTKCHSKLAHLYEKHFNDNKKAKYHYAKAIELDPQNITRRLLYALFLSDRAFEFHSAAKQYRETLTLYLSKINKSTKDEDAIYRVFDAYKELLLSKGKFFDDPDTFNAFAMTLLWFDRGHDAKDIMKAVRKRFPQNDFAKFIMDPYGIGSDNIIGEDDTNDSISEVTDISEPTDIIILPGQPQQEIKQSENDMLTYSEYDRNQYLDNKMNLDEHHYMDSGGQFEIVYHDSNQHRTNNLYRHHHHETNTTAISSHGNLYRRDQDGEWSPDELNILQKTMQSEMKRLSDRLATPPINLFQPNDIQIMVAGSGSSSDSTSSINNFRLEVLHSTNLTPRQSIGDRDINVATVKGSRMAISNRGQYWIDYDDSNSFTEVTHTATITAKTQNTTATATETNTGTGKISNFFDADMELNQILQDELRMTRNNSLNQEPDREDKDERAGSGSSSQPLSPQLSHSGTEEISSTSTNSDEINIITQDTPPPPSPTSPTSPHKIISEDRSNMYMTSPVQRHPFQSPGPSPGPSPPPIHFSPEIQYKQQQRLMNNSTFSHKSYKSYDNNEFNSDSTTNFGHNDTHLPLLSDHHFSNFGQNDTQITQLPLALSPNPRQISVANDSSLNFNLTPSGFRYESSLKWYYPQSQEYIDIGGILCDTHLFIVPIKQFLIWKEFEQRSQINYILDDIMTSLIQKKHIVKIIENLNIINQDNKYNSKIISLLLGKNKWIIEQEIIQNKGNKINCLADYLCIDNMNHIPSIKQIEITNFYNDQIIINNQIRTALIDYILSDISWISQEQYLNSAIITFSMYVFEQEIDSISRKLDKYLNDELKLSKLQISNVNIIKFQGYKNKTSVDNIIGINTMQYELGEPFQILAQQSQTKYIDGFELKQIHNIDDRKDNERETMLFLAPSNNYRLSWQTHLDFVINYDKFKYSDSNNSNNSNDSDNTHKTSIDDESIDIKSRPSLKSKQDSDRFVNDFGDQPDVIKKYRTQSTRSKYTIDNEYSLTSNHLDHEPNNDDDEDDDDEKNIIYLDYPESKFSYQFGFGEYLNYWEKNQERSVIPKYMTLKDELINNIVYKLTLSQYYSLYRKAYDLLYKEGYRYSIKAKYIGVNNKKLNILQGEYITINHCICMILYTDYNECPYEFKKYCRKSHNNESLKLLIERNSEIANWCRFLKETCMFYGSTMKKYHYFHTGLKQKLMFKSLITRIETPLSTTSDIQMAQKFQDDQGIICTFKASYDETSRYFDTQWLSRNDNEKEKFFMGCSLMLVDIMMTDLKSNSHWIDAMQLFERIFNGYFLNDINDEIESNLLILMNKYIHLQLDKDNYIEALFDNLVQHIIIKKEGNIWMNKHEIYTKLKNRSLRHLIYNFDENIIGEFLDHCNCLNPFKFPINYTSQFEWNINNDLFNLKFKNLKHRKYIQSKDYTFCLNNDTFDGVDGIDGDNKITFYLQSCAKYSHSHENIALFLYLKKLPKNIESVCVEFERYCNITQYHNLLSPQWLSLNGNNYNNYIGSKTFKFKKLLNNENLNSLHWILGIKIVDIQWNQNYV